MTVPTEFRSARLLLRPWRATDAALLHPVLAANQAHLGTWIPARVAKLVPMPELVERLAVFAADFVADREWRYGLFALDESRVLGEMSLFPRDATGRVAFVNADRIELGYWLRFDETGRGLATEAAQDAFAIASALPGLLMAEIRCDARNNKSAAVPARIGFTLSDVVRTPAAATVGHDADAREIKAYIDDVSDSKTLDGPASEVVMQLWTRMFSTGNTP